MYWSKITNFVGAPPGATKLEKIGLLQRRCKSFRELLFSEREFAASMEGALEVWGLLLPFAAR